MTSVFELYPHFITIIGELTVLFVLGCLICGFILLFLTIHAIRSGNLLFPKFMRAGLIFLEGMMRGLFKLFGVEDQEFLRIMVTLQNTLNRKAFTDIPVSQRAIFVPQCLRSGACPAHLHEEGLIQTTQASTSLFRTSRSVPRNSKYCGFEKNELLTMSSYWDAS